MLTAEQRNRLTVVLVGARNPGNIGAAARAMRDFGFSDLRVVNEFAPPLEAARLAAEPDDASLLERAAVAAIGAADILQGARRFDSLPEALADCSVVAATTAIGERVLAQPVRVVQEGAIELRRALAELATSEPTEGAPERVALLFGSEKTGLTTDQLSHASLLLTIPLFQPAGRHLSMNLGQAVAVCLYEIGREGFTGARIMPEQHVAAASAADRERLFELLTKVLENSGYSRRFPANVRPHVLRRLVGHIGSERLEVAMWMGIFRQLLRSQSADRHAS